MCIRDRPLTVLAGSPEFAYTAEKWASLRDDKLEFEEIADLVHEYNNTVIQNQIEYQDYRDQDKDDISDDYYEAAQDILNNLDYPDPDEAGFASRLSSYLSSKVQADSLMEKGDDNVDDGEIKKLGYDQTCLLYTSRYISRPWRVITVSRIRKMNRVIPKVMLWSGFKPRRFFIGFSPPCSPGRGWSRWRTRGNLRNACAAG